MHAVAVDALVAEYSYQELLEVAATMRREMARRVYIERMFDVLAGVGHLEDLLYWCYQRRLAEVREDHRLNGRWYQRDAYARLKAQPQRYAARLRYKAEHKRKQRAKTAPGYARGERSGSAKLTEAAVRDILTSPLSGVALSKKYGIAQSTISGIRKGTKWAHVERGSAS